MQVVILSSAEEIGEYAADVILSGVTSGSISVLGVATGSSPLPVYRALESRWVPQLAKLTVFALDEYVGLPYDHPESYHAVIDREVTRPLRLDPDRVHVPDGNSADPEQACLDYERRITDAGGIDLQILGIGATGHIGFNEPGSSLSSRTRVKTLSERTRNDNARFFPQLDDVPYHCVTQGLGTIMDATEVLLIALGAGKADAIAAALEGPVTTMCPGSVLQWHPHARVVLDDAAAAQLRLADYHRFTHEHRPTWQE
jgi:glucosamine-6-phosphate deaminase